MDTEATSLVCIVDDDLAIREALSDLFRSVGQRALAFRSTNEFLAAPLPDIPSCLILDVRLPGQSGLEFQDQVSKLRPDIPIIFITAHGDIQMSVRALKAGAINFLEKPFRDQEVLDAVNAALNDARRRRTAVVEMTKLQARYSTLSMREKEIMRLVTAGLMNKQIAGQLDVSEITVKVNRSSLMRKFDIKSLAELVRIARDLDIK